MNAEKMLQNKNVIQHSNQLCTFMAAEGFCFPLQIIYLKCTWISINLPIMPFIAVIFYVRKDV